VIGIFDPRDLTHELAHALYFTDAAYKRAAQKLMKEFDTSQFEHEVLSGYAKHVIRDEVQANLVAPGRLAKQFEALLPLRRKLRDLYNEHSAGIDLPQLNTSS
jgi:hypothetical protein